MSQLEDNAKHDDQRVAEQYPWNMYKYLPPAMAISIEATVLKEIYGQELTQEQCGELLKEAEFRDIFLRCWELGCFEEIRGYTKIPDQTTHTHLKDKKNTINSEPLPAGGKTIISNSAFYDIAGDWIINYSSNREEDMAKWISKHDQRVTHNAVAKKRAPGTGRWFLDSPELKELCQSSLATNRILWCPGMPGVGKTVIASLAIDYLRRHQKNAFVGFIYFDFKLRSIQDLNFAISSLYRQVFETCKLEDVMMAFEDMYHTHRERKTRPTVSELNRAISDALKPFECCFLVLDALDEYLDQYQDAKICELLITLLSLGSHVKLIVTSRPLSGIADLFKKLDSSHREVEATDEDIGRYVNARLDGQDFNFDISSTLRERVIDGVVKAAKGRFLIATLNMDHLADQLNPGDLDDTLVVLPDKEDAAYSRAMERIGGYSGNRRGIARKAIMLVAYCSRPLSIEELRHALAAKEGRYDVQNYLTPLSTITAACAGILVVRGNNIVFVHFTAQEYFDKCRIRDLHFPDADLDISLTCLNYLTLGILSDDTLAEDEFPNDLLERLPFFDYAALQWGFHSNKHGIQKDTGDFYSRVWRFLSENIQAVNYNATYLFSTDGRFHFGRYLIPGASLFVSVYHNQAYATQRLLGSVTALPRLFPDLDQQGSPLYFIRRPEQMPIIEIMMAKFGVTLVMGSDFSFLAHLVQYGLKEAVAYILMQPGINLKALHFDSHSSLHAAVQNDDLVIATHLLNFEAAAMATSALSENVLLVKTPDILGCTPFDYAVRRSVPMIKLLLRHGASENLNSLSDQSINLGETPLTSAICSATDPLATTTCLIEAGAMVNLRNFNGQTPLLLAAWLGNFEILRLILEHGGSETVNWGDNNGITPLSRAVTPYMTSSYAKTQAHATLCALLLLEQPGIDINLADLDGCTPLYHAYKARNTQLVQLLEYHGALLPDMVYPHKELLLRAAEDGVVIVVKMLLEKDEIVTEPRDAQGRTPLLLATEKSHIEIVDLLLSKPWVDVNAQDKAGNTPLHHSSTSYSRREVAKMLLQHPAIDLTNRDNDGCCPFNSMFKHAYLTIYIDEIVEMFLSRSKAISSMVNSQDDSGNAPIMYAAIVNSVSTRDLVEVLLEIPEVNRNIRDNNGRTPLMMACLDPRHMIGSFNSDCMDALLKESLVEVNAQDNFGRTALSLALLPQDPSRYDPYDSNLRPFRSKRRERIARTKVSMLFSRSELDVNLPDNAGRTPLWYARWLRYDEVAAMLIARGAV